MVNFLVQVFMGAVSGYYTNKLAISHLFTDIPLLGGRTWKAVIKKGGNKKRLAEDLSEIAENQILGGEKKTVYFYEEISKEAVQQALDECIEEIFVEISESSIGNMTLESLFFNDWKKMLEWKMFFLKLVQDRKLGEFIQEETFLKFFDDIWKSWFAADGGDVEHFLERVLLELSEGESDVTLELLLGTECCEKAEAWLIERISDVFGENLSTESERLRLEGYLQSICRQFGFGTIVRNILLLLREKTVGEILSPEGGGYLSEQLCVLLEQPQIEHKIKEMVSIFLDGLAQMDWKLGDLLPEDCLKQEIFTEILKEQLQDIEPFAASFYEKNEDLFVERLRAELEDVLLEGTGNFIQNMVLFSAKDTILEKVEEFLRKKMPDKIEQFFLNPSQDFVQTLCDGILQISVTDLVKAITPDTVFLWIKKACGFDKSHHQEAGFFVEALKKVSLSAVISDDMVDAFAKTADEYSLDIVKTWLNGEEKKEQITTIVHTLVQTLIHHPWKRKEAETVCRMLHEHQGVKKAGDWFLEHIAGQKQVQYRKEKKLAMFLYEQCSELFVRDVLKVIIPIPQRFFQECTGCFTIADVLLALPKEPIKKKVYEVFLKNAAYHLPVKKIVKEQVLSLDEDTLCAMMQNFMGTQLKPLNRIGGALGAVVGMLVWAVYPSMEITLPSVCTSVAAYGMIGVVTNMLALRGLFRPYHIEERAWLGTLAKKDGVISKGVLGMYKVLSHIPLVRNLFYLGYLPENKSKIAEKLAEFVAGNFLKPKALLSEVAITQETAMWFLRNHKETITEKVINILKKTDTKELASIVEKEFFRKSLQKKLNAMDFSVVVKKFYPAWEAQGGKPLGEYFHVDAMVSCLSQIQKQEKISKGSREKVQTWISHGYEQYVKHKTMEDLFASHMDDQQRKQMISYLYEEKLWNMLANTFSKKLDVLKAQEESTAALCFDKKVYQWYQKREDMVARGLFFVILHALQQYLEREEEKLVDKIDLEVQHMISSMADGMPLGGMAASMLGTRQMIAKVFHRAFIEPQPISSEETSEIFYRQRLLEEAAENHEEMLLEKIKEIVQRQMEMRTIGELWMIFFGVGQTCLETEQQLIQTQWSRQICHMLYSVWKQNQEQSIGIAEELCTDLLSFFGSYTFGDLSSMAETEWLETQIYEEIFMAVQKPSTTAACADFIRYGMERYVLCEPCGSVLSILTPSVCSHMMTLLWERMWQLPCMKQSLANVQKFHMQQKDEYDACFLLILEFLDAVWQREVVWYVCEDSLERMLDVVFGCMENKNDRWNRVLREVLASLERTVQYDHTDRKGLTAVAEQIDFERIIRMAVLDMTDAQIEALFQRFAGKYFLSLKLSGALGFVFGVPFVNYAAAGAALLSGWIGKRKA